MGAEAGHATAGVPPGHRLGERSMRCAGARHAAVQIKRNQPLHHPAVAPRPGLLCRVLRSFLLLWLWLWDENSSCEPLLGLSISSSRHAGVWDVGMANMIACHFFHACALLAPLQSIVYLAASLLPDAFLRGLFGVLGRALIQELAYVS